jgi:hypothetical protein
MASYDLAGQGDGLLAKSVTLYDPGFGCLRTHEALDLDMTGFAAVSQAPKFFSVDMSRRYWSTDAGGNALGKMETIINFPTITVTAKSQIFLDQLNYGCPCGGTWQPGVPRAFSEEKKTKEETYF